MNSEYSIAEARDHLARIVHEVESGGPVRLTRRGKPVAVIVAILEYERLQGNHSPWQAYQAWCASAAPLEPIDLEGLRSPDTGRSVSL